MQRNIIPVGKYDSDERWNTDHLVMKGERTKPIVVRLNPKDTVRAHKLYATQTYLDFENFGSGDPVFEDYEDKPCLVEYKGVLYIIDGHHRIAKAFKSNRAIETYLFL